MEEWAPRILQPNEEFQLKVLYVNDPETTQRWDRVTGKNRTTFEITEKDFTMPNTDSDTGNNNIVGLDTKANRLEGQSNQELALIVIVNSALIELLEKANKQKTQPTKISPKELANMKKTYEAASAFTAMVNKRFNKSSAYKDFELMHQAIDYDVKSNQANNNRSRQCHSKHSTFNENSDDDEPPPPCKRQKSGFKSVVTACRNESDDDTCSPRSKSLSLNIE